MGVLAFLIKIGKAFKVGVIFLRSWVFYAPGTFLKDCRAFQNHAFEDQAQFFPRSPQIFKLHFLLCGNFLKVEFPKIKIAITLFIKNQD